MAVKKVSIVNGFGKKNVMFAVYFDGLKVMEDESYEDISENALFPVIELLAKKNNITIEKIETHFSYRLTSYYEKDIPETLDEYFSQIKKFQEENNEFECYTDYLQSYYFGKYDNNSYAYEKVFEFSESKLNFQDAFLKFTKDFGDFEKNHEDLINKYYIASGKNQYEESQSLYRQIDDLFYAYLKQFFDYLKQFFDYLK